MAAPLLRDWGLIESSPDIALMGSFQLSFPDIAELAEHYNQARLWLNAEKLGSENVSPQPINSNRWNDPRLRWIRFRTSSRKVAW